MDDAAGNAVRPPQQARRMFKIADAQRIAHGGAGHALAIDYDCVHRFDPEAMPLTRRLQQVKIATAPLAEAEVIADDEVARAETLHQNPFDEFFRRQAGQFAAEVQHVHLVDTAGFEQGQLFAQAGQARRRLIGREEFARVRFEGHYRAGQAMLASRGREAFEQGAMSAMQAVEVADGQHAG
jgi:hypothetical protein